MTPTRCITACLLLLLSAGCHSPEHTLNTESPAQEAYQQASNAFDAGQLEQALDLYTRAIELDSMHVGAYVGRGRLFWYTHRYERAVPDLDRALTLDSNSSWAYFFRGVSLMNLRDFEAALPDLTVAAEAEALPPDFRLRARHFRAIGFMNLERYHDAVADLTTCIEHDPEQPLYRYERATLYEATDRPEAARADYEAFLRLTPEPNTQTEAVTKKLAALGERM